MMIKVDPNELVVVSGVLRNCAVETADIGAQLASCADCAMPPDLRSRIDQLIATIDTVLDRSASQLDLSASELSIRSQIAMVDMLAAATVGVGAAETTPSASVTGPVVGPLTGDLPAAASVAPAGSGTSGSTDPVIRLIEIAQQKQDRARAGLDAIINDPNSAPSTVTAAIGASSVGDWGPEHLLAPTRSELDSKYGYRLTDAEVRSISPHSLDYPPDS